MKITTIRSKKDFTHIFQNNHKIDGKFLRVLVAKSGLNYSRFAFVTPKTIDKRSTVRNLLRRRAREWLRQHITKVSTKPLDIIFFFKKESLSCSRAKFYEELEYLVEKIYN